MVRSGAWAAVAAGGLAGLGYYLVVTGKLTIDTGWGRRVRPLGPFMVLAEHHTPVHGGRLTAATLETMTFDRPHRIAFRLVRGPVPHVAEEFALTEHHGATRLDYSGELGTDFGAAGQWWAGRVAAAWEAAVRSSFAGIRTEAERRASPGTAGP